MLDWKNSTEELKKARGEEIADACTPSDESIRQLLAIDNAIKEAKQKFKRGEITKKRISKF